MTLFKTESDCNASMFTAREAWQIQKRLHCDVVAGLAKGRVSSPQASLLAAGRPVLSTADAADVRYTCAASALPVVFESLKAYSWVVLPLCELTVVDFTDFACFLSGLITQSSRCHIATIGDSVTRLAKKRVAESGHLDDQPPSFV
eukprot:s4384_g2.t1